MKKRTEDLSLEKTEIFFRVVGYLPRGPKDTLTREIKEEFIRKYDRGEIEEKEIPIRWLYQLCKEWLGEWPVLGEGPNFRSKAENVEDNKEAYLSKKKAQKLKMKKHRARFKS